MKRCGIFERVESLSNLENGVYVFGIKLKENMYTVYVEDGLIIKFQNPDLIDGELMPFVYYPPVAREYTIHEAYTGDEAKERITELLTPKNIEERVFSLNEVSALEFIIKKEAREELLCELSLGKNKISEILLKERFPEGADMFIVNCSNNSINGRRGSLIFKFGDFMLKPLASEIILKNLPDPFVLSKIYKTQSFSDFNTIELFPIPECSLAREMSAKLPHLLFVKNELKLVKK